MSTLKRFFGQHRLGNTISAVLTVALLVVLSADVFTYSGHATATAGYWTSKTPRPTIAEGLGAAAVGNTIFAIGGGNSASAPTYPESCHNDAYDMTTDSWSSRTRPIICFSEPAGIVSVAGLVYVISGACQFASPCAQGTETHAVQIYNPRTDTWSLGAPIPTARLRAGVSVYNGKIFVIGGYHIFTPFGTPPLNVVEVYDIVRNTWTTAASMPTAREGLLAATVGDNIFTIGGFTGTRAWFTATSVVEEYNIATNAWTTGFAPMPTPRGTVYSNGGVACGNAPVFVIGGMTTSGTVTNVNEAFIPSLNQWIERAPMPTPRGESGTGIVGSRLFVIGGGVPPEFGADTNVNEAFECSNTIAGKVTSGGLGVSSVTVTVSGVSGLIGTVLTALNGFYSIDLPAGGTYTVSATTLTGTVTTTINVPTGTITIQNLST